MNKFLLLWVSFLMIGAGTVFAQAKKPTIMIVPSDVWMNENGYMTTYNNQGTIIKIPDYKKAFQENSDLELVISMINGMMAKRGFPLKNMSSVIKTLELNSAEDNMMQSKKTGSGVSENPVDKLKKVAKADIIIQLSWQVNQMGPKKSISFNMRGIDAYTDKQIATAAGVGKPSFSTDVPTLLEEAVVNYIDPFNATLQDYFNDLFKNGREVVIRIKKWNSWDKDLESTYGPDDEELGEIIEDWLADNTVKGRFNTTDATEDMMLFEQVRIPLYYTRHNRQYAMDTRHFALKLSHFLQSSPYNIENKVTTQGLGQATIYLGSK